MKYIGTCIVCALLLIPAFGVHAAENSVDLLWQGETYTPPFYKGRSLWSNQSRITFVAIPHIFSGTTEIDSTDLIYRWKKDGTVIGTSSGIGKNSISFSDSILSKPLTVKMDIFSADDRVIASASATIKPLAASILVFESNPLYGLLLNREIGGVFALKEQEVTFSALPLFFSAPKASSANLDYAWRTNAGEAETNNFVTYRRASGASGVSAVSVRVSNTYRIIQSASKNFSVEFGDEQNL